MEVFVSFGFFLYLCAFPVLILGKECTNIPTQLSSHSLRYQFTSSNQFKRDEMLSHDHPIPTDDSAWLNLLPGKNNLSQNTVEEVDWAILYRQLKVGGMEKGGGGGSAFLKEVPLHDVSLDPDSMHGQAQQTNFEYLMMLDVDNLVWSFRKQAKLPTPGTPYGGWEEPNCELRGHFVGHYMSATAKMWASTHNDSLRTKMSSLVSALQECQKAIGTGYLSAFPEEQFDRFEAIVYVWAPYYTIHKIMAGLLDQYLYAGNNAALKMVVDMADYFGRRVQNVIAKYSLERHWTSLNDETGGMNDVLYNLYTVTGDQKHLVLAYLFDKPCFLGFLAIQADSLSGFHANTHIPVVIGSQMRFEVTGNELYKTIGKYFMDIVNSSHAYATGGTSVSEFWSNPKRLADTLQTENEESCTTYNMLKVSRNLFRWTKEVKYADYYERALTNGVLSIQRGREPGIMIYTLPLGKGVSKARSYHGWGTKFDSFWCCYGTAIESFSKLGDSIYFEEDGDSPGLYIIQYILSNFNWRSGKIFLRQIVQPVNSADQPHLQVSFTISITEETGRQSNIYLRIPSWTHLDGARAALNGEILDMPLPGNFLLVPRGKLNQDNILILEFPISLRTEAIKDDRLEFASIQAILYGHYLLAGLSNGDWDIETGGPKSLSHWISPIPSDYNSQLVSLIQEVGTTSFIFTKSNESITMEKVPNLGTDSAVHATFRLFPANSSSQSGDLIGESVILEPFDLPGMAVTHQGPSNNLTVANANDGNGTSIFQMVNGLDGKSDTVSFKAKNENCYLCSGGVGENVKLKCQLGNRRMTSDTEFSRSASFGLRGGMSAYHPISFTAKGANRNYLLMPLLSLRDESYTVYFNIKY